MKMQVKDVGGFVKRLGLWDVVDGKLVPKKLNFRPLTKKELKTIEKNCQRMSSEIHVPSGWIEEFKKAHNETTFKRHIRKI